MKNWPKVTEFCDQFWNFTNFAPGFYQICIFFVAIKKLSSNLESLHLLCFPQNVTNAKLEREMVMENQEMVMEKSWKNILSSLWEPCSTYWRRRHTSIPAELYITIYIYSGNINFSAFFFFFLQNFLIFSNCGQKEDFLMFWKHPCFTITVSILTHQHIELISGLRL